MLLADASADGHILAFAEGASTAGPPVPPVIRIGAEDLRRPDQLQSLAQDRDLVIIECPPLAREVQRAALMVTDLAGLPCRPRSLDPHAPDVHLDCARRRRAQGHLALDYSRPQRRHHGQLHDAAVGRALRRSGEASRRAARGPTLGVPESCRGGL